MKTKDKDQTYPVQLTWKQTWVLIVAALGMVGGIFTAGIAFQNRINTMAITDLQIAHKEEIGKLKLSLGSELDAATINRDFYRDQYRVTKERLDTCLKGGTYFNGIFKEDKRNED